MEEEQEIIEDNHPKTFLESQGLTPAIYDGFDLFLTESNTLTIRIDGRINADLNWTAAISDAKKAIEKGFSILWEINLGLFDQLKLPLESQSQFLSLTLSLEHFRDTLWKDFGYHSIGLTLYRGNADFSTFFNEDSDQRGHFEEWLAVRFPTDADAKHQFRSRLASIYFRDIAVEYIDLLAARLPDYIPTFLFLDASGLPIEKQLILLNPDRFEHLQLAIRGSSLPFQAWSWQNEKILPYRGDERIKTGVCLPLMDCNEIDQWSGLTEAIEQLNKRDIPYRLIAESHLISSWQGLDNIIYAPEGLSGQGKRKLQGFCAAGGTAVSVSRLIGLPYEELIEDWLTK